MWLDYLCPGLQQEDIPVGTEGPFYGSGVYWSNRTCSGDTLAGAATPHKSTISGLNENTAEID